MTVNFTKETQSTKEKSFIKGCPKCQFDGNDSDPKKFSHDQINRFPKGYGIEKHPKIITKTISGQQVQEFVKDNNKIVFVEIKRCPVCGYEENKK